MELYDVMTEIQEIEYNDLNVRVAVEWVEGFRSGTNYGYITSWTYRPKEVDKMLALEAYLKKDEPTDEDVKNIDIDKFKEFCYEFFMGSAEDDAQENFKESDVSYEN